jgi:hypothetical protein
MPLIFFVLRGWKSDILVHLVAIIWLCRGIGDFFAFQIMVAWGAAVPYGEG